MTQAIRSSSDEKEFCDIVYQVAALDSSLSVDIDKILAMHLGITTSNKKPQLSSQYYMKSFYFKREGIEQPKTVGNGKFEENLLASDLQKLSDETTISGFNEMSQKIEDEQNEQIAEDNRCGNEWGVDDDW